MVPPAPRVAAGAPNTPPGDSVLRTAAELWSMLEEQCSGSASAEARLELFEIAAYDGLVVRVRPKTPSQEARVRSLETWIGERLSQVVGKQVRAAVEGSGAKGAPAPAAQTGVQSASRMAAMHADPVVRLALDLFDGRIVGIDEGSQSTEGNG